MTAETTETERPTEKVPVRPAPPEGPRFRVVDESFGHGSPHPSDTLRRVYRVYPRPGVRPLTVRVSVHADYLTHQSYAKAEVLTSGLSWTELIVNPPSAWRPNVIIGAESVHGALDSVAKGLIERAAAVLDTP